VSVIIENILDVIESNGEDETLSDLSSFSCPLNLEIEDFLRCKAIDFAKRKLSVTYIVTDLSDGQILGYFTLAHKAIDIPEIDLSKTSQKKIQRYARFDPISGTYTLSAFLIAQIGKNYAVDHGNRLTGSSLMNYALDILSDIQHRIGGGVVYLDAENRSALISFYENTVNFKFFGERYSENDKTKYLQFMRFL